MNYIKKLNYQSILLILINQIFICQNNELSCVQPIIRLDNGGVLVSHKQFSSGYYPNNLDCTYLIRAPHQFRIVIQLNYLNVEKEQNCNSDYIEFDLFPIFPINKTRQVNTTRICGNDDNKRLISRSNQMVIKFHSDSSVNYEGFSLRYYFVSDIDIKSGLVSWIKSFRNCTGNERKCESSLECYPKQFQCDGIRDCRDNSDELNCPRKSRCHQSQLRCKNGDCVAKEMWCNGYKDCSDGSDEGEHCEKSIEPQPTPSNDTSLREERCSRQVIKPKKLKLDRNETASDDDPQIIGGESVIPGSWPWIGSLRYGNSHFCGASLIRKQWAITAAHCVILNPDPNAWKLDLGRHFKAGNSNNIYLQSMKIKKIVIHPDFNIWTFSHDIALLKLEKEVRLDERVQTVCLPSAHSRNSNDQLDKTKRCVILGWGYTEDLVSNEEGVLKQAVVPIVDEQVCRENYKRLNADSWLDKSMMCAGYKRGGVDSCQGDSGGPLLCLEKEDSPNTNRLFKLYGVISWGEGCALANKPGVYAKITSFKDWLFGYIGLNVTSTTPSLGTTSVKSTSIRSTSSKGFTTTKSTTADKKITTRFTVSKTLPTKEATTKAFTDKTTKATVAIKGTTGSLTTKAKAQTVTTATKSGYTFSTTRKKSTTEGSVGLLTTKSTTADKKITTRITLSKTLPTKEATTKTFTDKTTKATVAIKGTSVSLTSKAKAQTVSTATTPGYITSTIIKVTTKGILDRFTTVKQMEHTTSVTTKRSSDKNTKPTPTERLTTQANQPPAPFKVPSESLPTRAKTVNNDNQFPKMKRDGDKPNRISTTKGFFRNKKTLTTIPSSTPIKSEVENVNIITWDELLKCFNKFLRLNII